MKENTKKKVQCNGPKNIFYVSRLPFLHFDKTSNKQYLKFIKAIKKINKHHFFFQKNYFHSPHIFNSDIELWFFEKSH